MKRIPAVVWLALLTVLIGLPVYLWETTYMLDFGVDWTDTYLPATRILLSGQNPYVLNTLHNPIWVLFALVPFAVLGEKAGMIALFFSSLFAFAYTAYRMHAKRFAFILFLLTPVVFYSLYLGNIDALVVLGFVLPAPLGLFLVLLKPQIGITAALVWAYLAWREGGLRQLVVTFIPVSVAFALTFIAFGNWLSGHENVIGAYWNMSLFPWSIPAGLAALFFAWKRRKATVAMATSPLFSPYLQFGSWSVLLLGFLEDNRWMLAAFTLSWLLVLGSKLL